MKFNISKMRLQNNFLHLSSHFPSYNMQQVQRNHTQNKSPALFEGMFPHPWHGTRNLQKMLQGQSSNHCHALLNQVFWLSGRRQRYFQGVWWSVLCNVPYALLRVHTKFPLQSFHCLFAVVHYFFSILTTFPLDLIPFISSIGFS